MNSLLHIVEPLSGLTSFERIGWVLMHSIWQDAAVAAALWVALAILRRRSAQTCYVVAWMALVLMALAPLATAALPATAGAPRVMVPRTESMSLGSPAKSVPPIAIEPQRHFERAVPSFPAMLRSASYAWLIGVGALSIWNLLGWFNVRRMQTGAVPATSEWQQTLERLARKVEVGAGVALRVCERVPAPAVVGWLRPMVLVPASVLTELPAAQLEAIFLHELAHVRRHDYLFNLIQTGIETLLFYHPAVWWVGRQIRREREHCCDDMAAHHCGSAVTFAKALASVETIRAASSGPALAMGATGGDLLRRIERLVGRSRPRARAGNSPLVAGITLMIFMSALAAPGLITTNAVDPPIAPATSTPATVPAAQSTVRPEDLTAGDPVDYHLRPNDLLTITLADLNGPNSQTIKQSRITETGNISLPFLKDPIHASELTEIELERAIVTAYRNAKLIENASVSVTIVEASGRMFSIMGVVAAPGNYPIPKRDFTLLSAIATAHGTGNSRVDTIRVLRQANDKGPARTIDVPAANLLEGDARYNIVIRMGDTIVVAGTPASQLPVATVRVVVGHDSLFYQGKKLDWEDLERTLAKLPARENTVLEIAPGSPDLTVGRYFDAQRRVGDLAAKLGFKNLQSLPQPPLTEQRSAISVPHYFVAGHVDRPGAFSLPESGVTLSRAIKIALNDVEKDATIQVLHRHPDGTTDVRLVSMRTLFHSQGNSTDDFKLEAGDLVTVK